MIPKFVPTKTSTATTYHFKIDPPDAFGWALCTVNDGTGELLITSDYGNWSHRWSADPNHLGHPTLTHFLGERAGRHYLADKLMRREERERFDARETVKHMQRVLCERRLEQGRALIDWYRDEEPEDRVDVGGDWPTRGGGVESRHVWISCIGRHEHWPLTKSIARDLFRQLGRLDAGFSTVEGFVEAFNEIEGHEWISKEPWHDDLRYRPDTSYLVLRDGILPALVEACAAEVKRRAELCGHRGLAADVFENSGVVGADVRCTECGARFLNGREAREAGVFNEADAVRRAALDTWYANRAAERTPKDDPSW